MTNRPNAALASIAATACLSQAGIATLPYVFGQLVDRYGFSFSQTGAIGAAETLAFGITMLGLSLLVRRRSPRSIALGGTVILVVAGVGSVLAREYSTLFLARVMAGIGFGALYVSATAAAARWSSPQRAYAWSTAAMTVGLAAANFVMPSIVVRYGPAGVFGSTVVLAVFALPLIGRLAVVPDASVEERLGSRSPTPWLRSAGLLLVCGVVLFSLGTTAIYPFAERIAHNLHIPPQQIGLILGSASIVGVTGSFAADRLGSRYGRWPPLLIGTVICGMTVLAITYSRDLWTFAGAQVLYVASWWFAYSLMLSLGAALDPIGRLSTVAAGAYMLSTAMGTGIAGLMADAWGFRSIGWATLGTCVTGSVLFVVAARGLLSPYVRRV